MAWQMRQSRTERGSWDGLTNRTNFLKKQLILYIFCLITGRVRGCLCPVFSTFMLKRKWNNNITMESNDFIVGTFKESSWILCILNENMKSGLLVAMLQFSIEVVFSFSMKFVFVPYPITRSSRIQRESNRSSNYAVFVFIFECSRKG